MSFTVSTDSPPSGQPVEVGFQYLDEAERGTYSLVLLRADTREEVDQGPVADAASRVSLAPPTPGGYTIEFRRHARMVAHRRITAREGGVSW